jgi:hypothetical protein
MRFPRSLAFALALGGLASITAPAAAQLTVGEPAWNTERGNRKEDVINRRDCLDDAEIEFDTSFATNVDGSFQLWAGAGCEDAMKRTTNGCVHVGDGSTTDETVTVRVQNLVKSFGDTAEGTDATCDTGESETLTERTLFFLVINSGTDEVLLQGAPAFVYNYDIVAPDPPTMVSATSGEASLNVEFEAADSADLDNYRFYCAAAESDCNAATLAPGTDPVENTYCGDIDAQGSAAGSTDDKLQNSTLYAVGVASTDEAGNVGKLSELACATPLEVTGFFEAYRAAGGKAGGGFCSFAPARRSGAPFAAALLLGALGLWRRRR